MDKSQTKPERQTELALILALAAFAFFAAWVSNIHPQLHYDYTFRIAEALLQGELGIQATPPSWLSEFVPLNGRYYSVFPLGSVISMLPFAVLKYAGLITQFPARFLASSLASAATVFAFLLCSGLAPWRRVLWALAPVFGTCLWPNLVFAGAWQIALGFAVVGGLGSVYFTLENRKPFVAGIFFAMTFGNRTELLLTAPVLYYFLLRETPRHRIRQQSRTILAFSAVPFVLGILTLAYNWARFGVPWDFGYARIPGVLDEPWYRHGIFSLTAIPLNVYHMLFEPWKKIGEAPWLVPTGWGGSIFLYSPFLFLLFRSAGTRRDVLTACWVMILVLLLILWMHGNPGGWQVSYRYATILLPWAMLILFESARNRPPGWEPALIVASLLINAYATWAFCWSGMMKP